MLLTLATAVLKWAVVVVFGLLVAINWLVVADAAALVIACLTPRPALRVS